MRKAALCLAAACALAALPAHADPRALGMNVHDSDSVGLDATRDSLVGKAPKFVRIDVNWFDVEKAPGMFDWTVIDAVVDGAKQRGLEVLAVLAYTPAWASAGDTKGGGTLNDVPKDGKYAAFVTAAVNHLKNRVTHYEIWNEPNLGGFFEGTPNDYLARVLVPGASALHAACNSCKVVAPGLASIGKEYGTWMDTVLANAASHIDIVSGHAYAGFPQESASIGVTSDSFFNKIEKHRVITVGGVTVFEGPLSFKEVMDKRGVAKPFWLTETGREATLGKASEEQAQLAYYQYTLEAMVTRPWWQATIFYEAFDEPPAPWRFGVCVHDASEKIGYKPKAVMGYLQKITSTDPLFGGEVPSSSSATTTSTSATGGGADAASTTATSDAATSGAGGAPAVTAAGAGGTENGESPGDSETQTGGCQVRGGATENGLAVLAAMMMIAVATRRRPASR